MTVAIICLIVGLVLTVILEIWQGADDRWFNGDDE